MRPCNFGQRIIPNSDSLMRTPGFNSGLNIGSFCLSLVCRNLSKPPDLTSSTTGNLRPWAVLFSRAAGGCVGDIGTHASQLAHFVTGMMPGIPYEASPTIAAGGALESRHRQFVEWPLRAPEAVTQRDGLDGVPAVGDAGWLAGRGV